MVVVPTSDIYLIKTPMELDEKNTLTFANATAQFNYFNSLPKISLDNATYQRKDGEIRFPTSINTYTYDDLLNYNYCMYRNESYSNKWFYAFVTDLTYENDGMTKIKIETDVMQTWKFEINYKPSFIEREHIAKSADVPGANLVEEGLETGDFTCNEQTSLTVSSSCIPCMAVTTKPYNPLSGHPDTPIFKKYNGIYSGVTYLVSDTQQHFSELLKYYNDAGILEQAVQYVFMIPSIYAQGVDYQRLTFGTLQYTWGEILASDDSFGFSISAGNKPTSVDGYIPRNKKLLTSPYSFLNVDNNAGSVTTLKYEDFSTIALAFNVEMAISPGCAIKFSPAGYKGVTSNHLYSFNMTKLPICSYGSDVYTNWLTQNGVNIATDIISSGVELASGNVAGAGMSIFSNLAQSSRMQMIPNSVKGNVNSGDIIYSMGIYNPIAYKMSIKLEKAHILDEYFDMYGYKTNRVKTPNLENRSNWNYVKMINCNITGEIPQKDMERIKQIFNDGVTLWHNPSTFLDYSQNNN